ncbi:MAG: biotin/lipoyl-binding protein, partial [Firmicutes bacterium]|nr:biotin/lipoyl-binding protein [Bacillota bacterium]
MAILATASGLSLAAGHVHHRHPRPGAGRVAVAAATVRAGTATVTLSGPVVPATTLPLVFETTGRLATLDVTAGQAVTAGQVIATLGTGVIDAQLAEAQAA